MAEETLDALIVGAGFGGCYLLKLLREQGLNVRIFEAGDTLGGVWCWNRYPGARVDCEFPYYGYSDPAIWQTYTWPERFPDHVELRKYFQHVSKVWDLNKDISLNTEVVEACYEGEEWHVKAKDGRKVRCKWFLSCAGTSFKPHTPEWKGKELFKGEMYHSTRWPDGATLKGKRVAVIGAGSTGVQLMQEAGKHASYVGHFIRTPNLAVPLRQRQVDASEVVHHRVEYPHVFKACRTTRTGLPVLGVGRATKEDTPEQQDAVFEERWQRGGFNWSTGCYNDYALNKEANRVMYDFWAKKQRARMKNPQKRDVLAPLEPPYFLGTKRPSLEQDYYEQCDKDHVEVTNSPIAEITGKGIKTKDGKERDFDLICVATGFDAVTGGLKTMGIKGRDGLELQEKWADGVRTNVGMMVHGFPNMYIVYGPQAPTSFTNGPPFIEMQCEWISDVISRQRKEGYATVEAKESEEQAWSKHVNDVANMTLAVHTDSWYMGANIPGKKREMLLYMGGIPPWFEAASKALDGWKGFDVRLEGSENARLS